MNSHCISRLGHQAKIPPAATGRSTRQTFTLLGSRGRVPRSGSQHVVFHGHSLPGLWTAVFSLRLLTARARVNCPLSVPFRALCPSQEAHLPSLTQPQSFPQVPTSSCHRIRGGASICESWGGDSKVQSTVVTAWDKSWGIQTE